MSITHESAFTSKGASAIPFRCATASSCGTSWASTNRSQLRCWKKEEINEIQLQKILRWSPPLRWTPSGTENHWQISNSRHSETVEESSSSIIEHQKKELKAAGFFASLEK